MGTGLRWITVVLWCLAGFYGVGRPAYGAEQHIDSTLTAEGFSFKSADGKTIERRRIVENLYYSVWRTPAANNDGDLPPVVSVQALFRLNSDYGVGRATTNPADTAHFVPGARQMNLEAVLAAVRVDGALGGHLSLALGRQVLQDPVGFVAIDGAWSRVDLGGGVQVASYGGAQVLGGQALGYDDLELDGTDNGGRGDLGDALFTSRTDPVPHLCLGSSLVVAPNRFVELTIGGRLVNPGGGLRQKAAGATLFIGTDRWRLDGQVVVNPMVDRVSSGSRLSRFFTRADAQLGVRTGTATWFSLQAMSDRPVYATDSIFNVFGAAPRRDLGGRLDTAVGIVQLAGWGFVRLAEGEPERTGQLAGGGGGVGSTVQRGVGRLSGRVSAERVLGAGRLLVEAMAGRSLVDERLDVTTRIFFWKGNEPLFTNTSGSMMGLSCRLGFRFTERGTLLGLVESAFGVWKRPSVLWLGALQVDLWR